MALNVSENGGVLIPEGQHEAYCSMICDIGEHRFEDRVSKQVIITWTLPKLVLEIQGAQRAGSIDGYYTASLNENANLRKLLQSWRGRAFTDKELKSFDLKNVLGAPCLLQIIHVKSKDGKTRAKVESAVPYPKSLPALAKPTPTVSFDMDTATPEEFELLPDRIQNRVASSLSFPQMEARWKHQPAPSAYLTTEQLETLVERVAQSRNADEIEAELLSHFAVQEFAKIPSVQFDEAMVIVDTTEGLPF